MLAWPTGMIGLPLRLLAREVYERVVEQRGPDVVALVTGEEKRIPEEPRYWVCTVEAMPLDLKVFFVAVDEIQLAGDRHRGHTFTDRLMNCRGTGETMFLGAMTIAPLLTRLLGDVEIDTAERLSKLSWGGVHKLASVPGRSAVVAFSAEKVYEAAERLRAVHGGAAVVLGALSPRTRNAQVEMYQAGEVKHLVATDAIGMGLNMDLAHVAFTDVRKFDGRGFRDLTAAEVAQIAGRAGRYRTDGTFGTLKSLGGLPAHLVEAVEQHRFPPLRRLFWRNPNLDFRNPDALLHSLSEPPPRSFLAQAFGEDDQRALEALLHRDAIRDRVRRPDALQRLWEVCRIPDYRKTRTGSHAELLSRIATHLLDDGEVPDDFVSERIGRLDRTDGDIETLMSRISWVRTWTYVAWQRGWTSDAAHWQEVTRGVEDRLSDALHERLTARFVDRRVAWVLRGADVQSEVAVNDGDVTLGGIAVGQVVGWTFRPDGGGLPKVVASAVRNRMRTDVLKQLRALMEASDGAITLHADATLGFDGVVLGQLSAGRGVLEPKVVTRRADLLEAEERERVRVRLQRWRDRWVERLFSDLDRAHDMALSPAAKGLVYAVRSSLGTVPRAEVSDNLEALTKADRRALARLDVRLGTHSVYVASLLAPAAQRVRGALWCLAHGVKPLPEPPHDGAPSVEVAGQPAGLLEAMGMRVLGSRAVRADVVERLAADVRKRARQGRPAPVVDPMKWLATDAQGVVSVVRGLGFSAVLIPDGRLQVRKRRR